MPEEKEDKRSVVLHVSQQEYELLLDESYRRKKAGLESASVSAVCKELLFELYEGGGALCIRLRHRPAVTTDGTVL